MLIGDSDFVSNGQVLTGGNGVLFTDSLAWLSGLGDADSASRRRRTGVGVPLMFISRSTLNLITFLTVILLPGAVLAAGSAAIWLRRGYLSMNPDRSADYFPDGFCGGCRAGGIQNVQPHPVIGLTPTPTHPATFTDFSLDNIQGIRPASSQIEPHLCAAARR